MTAINKSLNSEHVWKLHYCTKPYITTYCTSGYTQWRPQKTIIQEKYDTPNQLFILEVSTMTSKDDNSCNVVVHVPKNKKFYCIIDKSKT